MKTRLTENKILKRALRDAHFAREGVTSGDHWRSEVMRRVRQIGPLQAGRRFWPGLEHMVWRLAPVNGLLIVALFILFLMMGLHPGDDVLALLTAESEGPTLSQLFGLGG